MDSKEPRLAAFQSMAERRALTYTHTCARAVLTHGDAGTNKRAYAFFFLFKGERERVKLDGFHSGRPQQPNLSSKTP